MLLFSRVGTGCELRAGRLAGGGGVWTGPVVARGAADSGGACGGARRTTLAWRRASTTLRRVWRVFISAAALPAAAGMGGLETTLGIRLTQGFARAMWICAALCLVASIVTWLTVRDISRGQSR